ncbi:MAG: ATP-binding protein, partial [Microbacteriaceae bacterium]|nr:ATP-binding protein [Microbacteriaceae bacterium]
ALIAVISLLVVIGISRSRVRLAQPGLHRAARDEQLSGMRERFEEQAAAMVHDTILNHLAAIASAPDGPLTPKAAARIESDIEELVGGEWLLTPDRADPFAVQVPATGKLLRAIDEARELGLVVHFSGDASATARLDPAREAALGLAVKQCLVNVVTHAGTDRAEVVIYGSGDEVTVMVIDDGRGFSERETSVDRLGLRQSVRRRIEGVGGAVQVWSTPGTGTSVLIRVPATDEARTEPAQ